MANLAQALRERKLSVYRLAKLMNIPQSGYSRLSLKIKGFVNMRPQELRQICEIVSSFGGAQLLPEDLESETIWLRLIPEIQDSKDVAPVVAADEARKLDQAFKDERTDLV